jgi:hypothetical protein
MSLMQRLVQANCLALAGSEIKQCNYSVAHTGGMNSGQALLEVLLIESCRVRHVRIARLKKSEIDSKHVDF